MDCRSAVALRAGNDAQPVDSSVHVGRRPSLGPGVTIFFHIRTVLPFCSSLGGLQPKFYVFLSVIKLPLSVAGGVLWFVRRRFVSTNAFTLLVRFNLDKRHYFVM